MKIKNQAHDMTDVVSVNLASVSLASLRHRLSSALVSVFSVRAALSETIATQRLITLFVTISSNEGLQTYQ